MVCRLCRYCIILNWLYDKYFLTYASLLHAGVPRPPGPRPPPGLPIRAGHHDQGHNQADTHCKEKMWVSSDAELNHHHHHHHPHHHVSSETELDTHLAGTPPVLPPASAPARCSQWTSSRCCCCCAPACHSHSRTESWAIIIKPESKSEVLSKLSLKHFSLTLT